jgi:phosphotriesterase-related protein
MGSGWYRGAHYPAEARIDRRSVGALADDIVRDATDGVGETGIRSGIIGEIGTDKPWLSAQEERVFRAAAGAARRTGLAITTHAVQSTLGLHGEGRIVDNLRELLSRGHLDRILLSQDVCHDSQLRRYGGNGYTYLAETFLPRLRAAGVSDDEIRTITVDNPRRLLTST